MSIKDINSKLRSKRAICKVAEIQGISEEEIRRDMQEAIDATWESEDPAARAFQRQLFPNGKPTLEEFIDVMAELAEEVESRQK